MDYLEIRNAYNSLSHSGVLGMKWGVRKYTNYDGSLNYSGQKRYQTDTNGSMSEKGKQQYSRDLIKQRGHDIVYRSKTAGKLAGTGFGFLAGLGIGAITGAAKAIKSKGFEKLNSEGKSKNILRKTIGGAVIGSILGSTIGKTIGNRSGKKIGKSIQKREKNYKEKL
jgi:outer membrane lipoprotein SlyB